MNLESLLPEGRRRLKKRSPRFWVWFAAVIAAVILLVSLAVGVGVGLSKRNRPPPASVILPLYIYPADNSTWKPAYDAFLSRPDITFVVIVNPASGPGNTSLPDPQYRAAIAELRHYPNVQVLGYVRTDYARRALANARRDVAVYAAWPAAMSIEGIFLDEAPHVWDEGAVGFMQALGADIRAAEGIRGGRTIIHNPGTIPDPRLPSADVTVVFEHDYAAWQGGRDVAVAELPRSFRDSYSLMVHSVPETVGMGRLLKGLSPVARYLFVTNKDVDYYESFGEDWRDFVESVPG
ncbi:spherulin 4-like cell surface protein [Schizothecium vesticola]|uniref:Spherulin 4-like cell surface protein n=1 Tax=Schizothecium vesticola TaxID=314040 RepID=A0AA40EH98_9PEZI|nr:spherulin 4-like cell surface protein [Schizothecium vesticola]